MPRPAVARDVCHTIAAEVRAFCIRTADPARAAKYAWYFVEGYDPYGVDYRDPEWERNRKDWGERLRSAGPAAFLDAGNRYTPEAFARIGGWLEACGIRNWGSTDVLCSEVLSGFLARNVAGLDELRKWVASPHKYRRRGAPVMLIKRLDGCADYGELFSPIEPLMSDAEKVVQQGTGWFLREAWKRQPRAAESFLLRFKDTAPRLIVQYATEKMDAKGKNRFRRQRQRGVAGLKRTE